MLLPIHSEFQICLAVPLQESYGYFLQDIPLLQAMPQIMLLHLLERQQQLEIRPPEEAIIDFKMQEFIYNATLQMGQRLLQPTLLILSARAPVS